VNIRRDIRSLNDQRRAAKQKRNQSNIKTRKKKRLPFQELWTSKSNRVVENIKSRPYWIERKLGLLKHKKPKKGTTLERFGIVRENTNDRRNISVPNKSKDGIRLLLKEVQNNSWKERFKEILNHPEAKHR